MFIVLVSQGMVLIHLFVDDIKMLFFRKSFEQFEFDGCDNCDEYLGIKNNREMVYDCTSSNFDG